MSTANLRVRSERANDSRGLGKYVASYHCSNRRWKRNLSGFPSSGWDDMRQRLARPPHLRQGSLKAGSLSALMILVLMTDLPPSNPQISRQNDAAADVNNSSSKTSRTSQSGKTGNSVPPTSGSSEWRPRPKPNQTGNSHHPHAHASLTTSFIATPLPDGIAGVRASLIVSFTL